MISGSDEPIKLDICGGAYPIGKGFINVDVRPLPEVDVVADLLIGLPFRNCSVEEIVSCGTLEHFSPEEVSEVLSEMFRILKYEGKLIIGVPDLKAIMNSYLLNDADATTVNQYLYGSQKNPFDLHKTGFDFEILVYYLKQAGFSKYRKTEYSFPFHLPKFMMQVVCYKTENMESVNMNDKPTQNEEVEIDFTGERLIPGDATFNDLYNKHIARYLFARPYAKGKVVLDAGCGCGYGSHALAVGGAKQVIGIDSSRAAIAFCQKYYSTPDTVFLTSDCLRMPFCDESFDVVVSFEVLEHIEDYQIYLEQCARVLTEDGLFIISTPNKKIWQDKENPYHLKEFLLEELREILSEQFELIDILGQDISSEYKVREKNEKSMYAFQAALINYYDDSFRYTERQLSVLRENIQDQFDLMMRVQNDTVKQLIKCFDRLEENELHKESIQLIFDCLVPDRIKQMAPPKIKKWIKARVERKIELEHYKKTKSRERFLDSIKAAFPLVSREPRGKSDGKVQNITPFQAKRINFPTNPDRKKMVRPTLDPVPMSLGDITIKKEFVQNAMYFIALCRKIR